MTQNLTEDQFIDLVEDLYLSKINGNEAFTDQNGYRVEITNDGQLTGRYNLAVYGPTGKWAARYHVAATGIPLVAVLLYRDASESLPYDGPVSGPILHGNENGFVDAHSDPNLLSRSQT